MSKHPDMDDQKVFKKKYITVETLYKTYIRESNDVVKFVTRQMSPLHQENQKLSRSGTSTIFRGASVLESESEMTESSEFDEVNDEIRKSSSVSSGRRMTTEDNVEQVFSRAGQLSSFGS
jgi:hypothetical protein